MCELNHRELSDFKWYKKRNRGAFACSELFYHVFQHIVKILEFMNTRDVKRHPQILYKGMTEKGYMELKVCTISFSVVDSIIPSSNFKEVSFPDASTPKCCRKRFVEDQSRRKH